MAKEDRGIETGYNSIAIGQHEQQSLVGKDKVQSQTEEKPQHNRGNPRQQTFRITRGLRNWWLEVSALLLLLGSLVAVAATLSSYQDLPLSQWPLSISINALVAVFTFIIEATTVFAVSEGISQLKWNHFRTRRPLTHAEDFDRVGRGPFGSLRLLWATRWRHPLVSTGALVLLLSTATSPFLQQLVDYYSCEVLDLTRNSSIPRTSFFQDGGPSSAGMEISEEALSLGLSSSVVAGFFSQQYIQVPIDCPTGNCTIPKYRTIGYCSSCIDLSKEITFRNITVKSDNMTTPGLQTIGPGGINETSSAFGPTSLFTVKPYFSRANFTILKPMITSFYTQSQNSEDGGCNDADLVYNTKDPRARNWTCNAAGLAQCTLGPCVKTLDFTSKSILSENAAAVASNSFLDERVLGIEKFGSPGVFNIVDVACLNRTEIELLRKNGTNISANQTWITNLADTGAPRIALGGEVFNLTFPYDIRQECLYGYNSQVDNLLQGYLSNFLSGQVGAGLAPEGSAQLATLFQEGRVNFETIQDAFDRIAVSLTTYMRMHGDLNRSAPAQGSLMLADTCVKIRWAWITLPAALSISSIIFLAWAGFATRRAPRFRSGELWKSSSLPMLFTGLDQWTRKSLQDAGTSKEMSKVAKDTRVELSHTEDGWVFTSEKETL